MRHTRSRTINALLSSFCFAVVLAASVVTSTDAQQSVQIKGPKDASEQFSGNVYGPITSDDTLWRIAERYRQNKNLTVYQVMSAIYALNPDAFEDQNINLMVDGAMLKLPSERFVARFDADKAKMRAQSDEQSWARGEVGPDIELRNVKPPSPPVNQQDLNNTKDVLEQRLNTLDQTQTKQFDALQDQFAQSISSVESLLEDNQKLYARIEQVDADLAALRQQVEGDVQIQMDAQTASIDEMLSLLRQEQAQREAEQSSNLLNTLTSPIALTIISAVFTLSLLGGVAFWLLRKKPEAEPKADTQVQDTTPAPTESVDLPMDDDLLGDPIDELDDVDDDELFNDDDLLDDVLSSELEDSLDDELENFADLSDEMLVPDAADGDNDDAGDDLFEEGDSELGQDDLDSLFNSDDDDADLGIDISGEDDLLDELESDVEQAPEDLAQVDEVSAADVIEESETSQVMDQDELDALMDEAMDGGAPDELAAEDSIEQDDDSIPTEAEPETIEPIDVPDEAEISIDDLLEEAQQEQGIAEKLGVENDQIDEEILEKLDDEIKQSNQELDTITDNLINEIEQLEMMGGMLDEFGDEEDEIETPDATAEGIQDLDTIADDIDEIEIENMANAEEFAEPLPDDLIEELQRDHPEDDILEEDSLVESFDEYEGTPTDPELETEATTDDSVDDVLAEFEAEDTSADAPSDNPADDLADELLEELEAEDNAADDLADELLEELEAEDNHADELADELLNELENELDIDEDVNQDTQNIDDNKSEPNADDLADELLAEFDAEDTIPEPATPEDSAADELADELLEELEAEDNSADALADELLEELEAEENSADALADELLNELESELDLDEDAGQDIDQAPAATDEVEVEDTQPEQEVDDLANEVLAEFDAEDAIPEPATPEEPNVDERADELLDEQHSADTQPNFDGLDDELLDELDNQVSEEHDDVFEQDPMFELSEQDSEPDTDSNIAADELTDDLLDDLDLASNLESPQRSEIPAETDVSEDDNAERTESAQQATSDFQGSDPFDDLALTAQDEGEAIPLEDLEPFSEDAITDQDEVADFALEQEQDGVERPKPASEPEELEDVPGLDDWLTEEGGNTDTSILDELENADFDDLLSAIDEEPGSQAAADDATQKKPVLDNPDLDLDALFNEEPETSLSEDEFLSVDDLLEEANIAEAPSLEEDFDLDVSLSDFTGDTDDDDLIDVDIDSGQAANLDLARAYIDMDDNSAARNLLLEVMEQGNDEQKQEAQALLKEIGDA